MFVVTVYLENWHFSDVAIFEHTFKSDSVACLQ